MSAIANAVDAVVGTFSTLGLRVCDGAPTLEPDEDAIIVGFSREGPGVVAETGPAAFVSLDRENVTVACLISCVSGGDSLKPVRDRAVGFYETLAALIRQNKSLAEQVTNARLSAASLTQYLNESGATVELTFTVSCIAFV